MRVSLPGRPSTPMIDPDLLAVMPSVRAGMKSARDGADDAAAGPPRPVFVLGTVRSGVGLLTLSLTQHPNLFTALETNWFERFGMGLQEAFSAGLQVRNRSLLDVAGIEIEDFFAHFGEAIDRLMRASVTAGLADDDLDPAPSDAPVYHPQRWVDGSTSNAFAVFALLRLFPDAKFIHLVRDLYEVVDTLTTSETRGTFKSHDYLLPEADAYRHWLDTTRAAFDAEQAFGSATVMRLRRDDLILHPEASLRRCFDFIGEPFSPFAMRPFTSVTTPETPRGDVAAKFAHARPAGRFGPRAEAEDVNERIFRETPPADSGAPPTTYGEDLGRIMAMEMAFSERSARGQSAVPPSLPNPRQAGWAPGLEKSAGSSRSGRFSRRRR